MELEGLKSNAFLIQTAKQCKWFGKKDQMKPQSQIAISAQVWVCDLCHAQDPKSCGCNSTAHMEKVAAKKEANRQAARRSYEKHKQNQRSSHNEEDVENTKESGNGHCNGRSGEPKLNAVGKPYSESYDPNYKMRHRVGSASPISASTPQVERFVRKDTAKFTRLLDGSISAGLARDLYDELRAHGATFLVEALAARLSQSVEAAAVPAE